MCFFLMTPEFAQTPIPVDSCYYNCLQDADLNIVKYFSSVYRSKGCWYHTQLLFIRQEKDILVYKAVRWEKGLQNIWNLNSPYVTVVIWDHMGHVSLTFCELSKIFSRNLGMAEMVFPMRISSWNFVHVPKALLGAHAQSFSLSFSSWVWFWRCVFSGDYFGVPAKRWCNNTLALKSRCFRSQNIALNISKCARNRTSEADTPWDQA